MSPTSYPKELKGGFGYFNCFSKLFFSFPYVKEMQSPTSLNQIRPHHKSYALSLMLSSLQEELWPSNHNVQCVWKQVFHLSLRK